MAYNPLITEKQTFWTSAGAIASGYKLFIYLAGTTTKATTYQETTGTANTNPVVLNSRGEVPYGVYVAAGSNYKLVLAPSTDSDPPVAAIWTRDNLTSYNDTTVTVDQWQASGFTPTYVSATSFTVTGDRTSTFQVGRRIKSTNTGGTIYSTITASAYASVTTVTVVNDSGVLDSGLSAVSVGLLTPTNPSDPVPLDTYPVVSGSSDRTKKLRFEVDTNVTTGVTRALTIPSADGTIAITSNANGSITAISSPVTGTGLASTAQVQTGTATDVLVAPGTQGFHKSAAKAWVNFNGTGTVAIRSSYNVTSITDNGVGDYTANFTTALTDANYAAIGTAHQAGATVGVIASPAIATGNRTTSSLRFYTTNLSAAVADFDNNSLVVNGN